MREREHNRGEREEKREEKEEKRGEGGETVGQRASTASSTALTPPQVTSRYPVSFSFCSAAICIFMQNVN